MSAVRKPLPGVSIVTVALNAASALPLTLESAIAQDHADKEVIVVDGASWDASDEVLRRYAPALDRIVTAEDSGIYQAMNDALAHVTRPYVLFLNAGDQFFCANAVSRIVAALENDPDVFYGDHIYVERGLELFRRAAPFEVLAGQLADGQIDGIWLDRIPCHQATFVRTDLLRALGFDTRLRISADHDLLFRAHAHGAKMQYVDEIVSHYFGGGFSMAAGERTKLEGATVYRRYSDRPDLVDRFFYPQGSPLAPQTRRTGVKLGGFLPTEGWAAGSDGSRGGDWLAASGGELLSPERDTMGLALAGYCEIDDQSVEFLLGGETIARAEVPRGFFRLEVRFDRSVPTASTIRVRPGRSQLLGDRHQVEVGFALRSFRFADTRAGFPVGLKPGEHVRFQSASRAEFVSLLGGGWSEAEAVQMWSLGPQAELWLKLAPDASRLRLAVSGNPHVPGKRQRLALMVNGHQVAEAEMDNGGHAMLEVDCGDTPWRRGAVNHLVLRPDAFATPPAGSGDLRPLGFCLWQLDVE